MTGGRVWHLISPASVKRQIKILDKKPPYRNKMALAIPTRGIGVFYLKSHIPVCGLCVPLGSFVQLVTLIATGQDAAPSL